VDDQLIQLLLVHGFAQTSASWQSVLPFLSQNRPVYAIDLRGHGKTALTRGMPTIEGVRSDLIAQLDELEWEKAAVWGYSQGARVALDLALNLPDRVAALVLESGTAGIEDPDELQARIDRDEELAKRIESNPIEDFVELWERWPILSGQNRALVESQREDRLSHDPKALAAALRGIGQASYEPMWDQLGNLSMPTLLLTGGRDAKYCAIAERLLELIPNCEHEEIAGVGHSVHLEQPHAAPRAVEKFLDKLA
jgi:2-succinyl-6-hydroxy-2,4-cyclohexadiene-1-carboxylate synthase